MRTNTFLYAIAFCSITYLFACNEDISKGTSTAKPIKVNASELMKKFVQNPKKYDTIYAQKALQVDGEIVEIEAASLGNTIFVLKTDNTDGAQIKCEMLNDDMQYQPGDPVTIKGFFKEYQFHIRLDKCVTTTK